MGNPYAVTVKFLVTVTMSKDALGCCNMILTQGFTDCAVGLHTELHFRVQWRIVRDAKEVSQLACRLGD